MPKMVKKVIITLTDAVTLTRGLLTAMFTVFSSRPTERIQKIPNIN